MFEFGAGPPPPQPTKMTKKIIWLRPTSPGPCTQIQGVVFVFGFGPPRFAFPVPHPCHTLTTPGDKSTTPYLTFALLCPPSVPLGQFVGYLLVSSFEPRAWLETGSVMWIYLATPFGTVPRFFVPPHGLSFGTRA